MATDALRLIDHLSLADVHVGGISMGGMITQWMVLQLAEFNAARARPPIRIHRIILGCTTPGGAGTRLLGNSLAPFLRSRRATKAFREAPPHADFMGAFKGGSADGPLSAAAKRDIVEKTMIVNLTHDYVRRHPDRLASLVDENLRYRRSLRGIMNQMMGVATHDSAARLHEIGELVEATLIIHGDSDLVVPLSNGMALKRGIRNSRMVVLPDVGHVCAHAVCAATAQRSADASPFSFLVRADSGRWTTARAPSLSTASSPIPSPSSNQRIFPIPPHRSPCNKFLALYRLPVRSIYCVQA